MRLVALLPVVALTAVVISSCNATTSGNPSPAPTQTAAPTSATSDSLASLKACSLLSSAEAQQVVPGAGAAEDNGPRGGSASDCEWTKAATSTSDAVVFGVTVRPNQTLDQVNAGSGSATTGAVNAHQARQVKGVGGNGTCLLAVAVADGRVDMSVDAGLDSDQACDIAGKIADIVEPKLPA